jgi:hypothetical protein
VVQVGPKPPSKRVLEDKRAPTHADDDEKSRYHLTE